MRKLFILTLLAVVGCTRQSCDLTAEQKLEIANELRSVTHSIFELANKKDPSYNNAISDNATAVFSGTVMDSWLDHKKQMAVFFAAQDKIESSIEIIEVNVLSNSSAIVVGKYKILATDIAGNSISSPPSCITYVYQRLNNEWKVIHFHDSEQR